MITFTGWLEEKKKEKEKDKTLPSQTTIRSAPIRGANQDQTGFNASGDVADYTVSD